MNPEGAFPSELWHGVWLRPPTLLQVPHAHSKPGRGLGLGETMVPSQTGDYIPPWLPNPRHFSHVTLMGPEFPGELGAASDLIQVCWVGLVTTCPADSDAWVPRSCHQGQDGPEWETLEQRRRVEPGSCGDAQMYHGGPVRPRLCFGALFMVTIPFVQHLYT